MSDTNPAAIRSDVSPSEAGQSIETAVHEAGASAEELPKTDEPDGALPGSGVTISVLKDLAATLRDAGLVLAVVLYFIGYHQAEHFYNGLGIDVGDVSLSPIQYLNLGFGPVWDKKLEIFCTLVATYAAYLLLILARRQHRWRWLSYWTRPVLLDIIVLGAVAVWFAHYVAIWGEKEGAKNAFDLRTGYTQTIVFRMRAGADYGPVFRRWNRTGGLLLAQVNSEYFFVVANKYPNQKRSVPPQTTFYVAKKDVAMTEIALDKMQGPP